MVFKFQHHENSYQKKYNSIKIDGVKICIYRLYL